MTTLRETLAEHWREPNIGACICDDSGRWMEHDEYDAHLETVVLAWVGARLAGARDGATLAIGRADGQPWESLAEAPSSGRFMGYPEMADAALTAVRDALGVPVAPNSAPVDVDPTSALAAEFDRSNDTDGIPCDACPFLGCRGCQAEVARRANGEAK